MMIGGEAVDPIVTLSEAQAFTRVETGEEEALLGGLVRSASALCEAFLGQVVIARSFVEEVAATCEWQRLKSLPVRSIDGVSSGGMALSQNGIPEPIRQGVLRLVAHLFAARDDGGGEMPAAVTALWRPYRRMRLA